MSFLRKAVDLTPAVLLVFNLAMTIAIVYIQKNKFLASILRLVVLSITIISSNLSLILKAPSLTGRKQVDRYIDYGIAFCQVAIATFSIVTISIEMLEAKPIPATLDLDACIKLVCTANSTQCPATI
jgi:hypothetical protein